MIDMALPTRSGCGICYDKEGYLTLFQNVGSELKALTERVPTSESTPEEVSKFQDLVWKIANDAQTVGEESMRYQVKRLLGIDV